ncbi:MAG: sulfatase, partial [Thermoanaerobaculia bacterium]
MARTNRTSRRAVFGALALAFLPASGCGRAPRPNVVLISIDTLRADRLGCSGWKEAETPVLDAVAAEGTRFSRVYAPAPLTLPSHTTMLTGLDPPAHGQRVNGMASAELGAKTLAERLSVAGWETGGFVAAFVLNRTFGLDRGFTHFDDGPPEESDLEGLFRGVAPGNERVDRALEWIGRKRDKPFFLFLHLYDVHEPHVPPPGFEKRFAARPYDGEVAFVDGQVGRVLHQIEARGLAKQTLVVVTSDHGEGLGEHGEETHGVLLYDATLHVPLLVRYPGHVPLGKVIDEVAGLVDVTPTILDLVGVKSDTSLQGRSLFGKEPSGERVLWAETLYPQRTLGWAP